MAQCCFRDQVVNCTKWLVVLATVSRQGPGSRLGLAFSPLACFSEMVENKCSGIWAAVNGNKCMVYIFFLNSWKPYYHMAGYKITPPLF